MAVKNIAAKAWSIIPSSDGKRYSAFPAGDAIGGGGTGGSISVSGVTGTVSNGNILTIAGSNLWAQANTNWDPFFKTAHVNASGFEGANPAADGYTVSGAGQTYDSTVHLFGAKSMKCTDSGAHTSSSQGGSSFYFAPQISLGTGPDDAYWRSYVRWNANEWPNAVHKFWWMGGGATPVFLNMSPRGGAAPTHFAYQAPGVNGDALKQATNAIPGGAIQNDKWYCVELHVKKAGAPSPIIELWVDDVLLDSDVCSSGVSANPGGWGFEVNSNWWDTTAAFNWTQWMDGFIISSTRVGLACKVEIGNSPVYASATKVYQRPTSIANGSVSVECNLTGLGAGPYYMWVTNSIGERSSAVSL